MSHSDWSDSEIQATVDAYFQMLLRESTGQPVNKAFENRALRENSLIGRTKGSVELRMQNISTVFEQLGLQRISGYKPAKNVGANVSSRIRAAVARLSNRNIENLGSEWFEEQKSTFLYNYLISNSAETLKITDELTKNAHHLESRAGNFYDERPTQLELEKEIVGVIERGASVTELSVEAFRYLSVFLDFFWDALQKFLNVMAVITLLTTFQSATEEAKTPEDIRFFVKSLSPEQKKLLEGHSIVIGDEVILRAKPNKKSEELTRLKKGTWVEKLEGSTSSWIHILAETDGEALEGWIYRTYLIDLH